MSRVLVAFHSRRGHVERLADAVAAGARAVPGTEVSLRRVGDVTREELLACDALVVGTPVHSGSMAAPVKQFFDDWHLRFDFYPDRPMRDRVGAAFAAGGQGDGGREFAMLGILAAMLHHHMLVVAGDSGIGASAATEEPPVEIDARELERATALGRRVAGAARLLRAGRDALDLAPAAP
jgi:NAD(P)H dehydrogenase (quinone)